MILNKNDSLIFIKNYFSKSISWNSLLVWQGKLDVALEEQWTSIKCCVLTLSPLIFNHISVHNFVFAQINQSIVFENQMTDFSVLH